MRGMLGSCAFVEKDSGTYRNPIVIGRDPLDTARRVIGTG
jgi:hypothetical protein